MRVICGGGDGGRLRNESVPDSLVRKRRRAFDQDFMILFFLEIRSKASPSFNLQLRMCVFSTLHRGGGGGGDGKNNKHPTDLAELLQEHAMIACSSREF